MISDADDQFWDGKLGPLVNEAEGRRIARPNDLQYRPRDLSPEAVRDWISTTCKLLDVSPSAVALKAGLAASTLNRFLRGEKKQNMNADTIRDIAMAFATVSAELDDRKAPIRDVWHQEAAFLSVPVIGTISPGEYVDSPLFKAPWKNIQIPRPRKRGEGFFPTRKPLFAFECPPALEWLLVSPRYPLFNLKSVEDDQRVLCHFRKADQIETIEGVYKVSPRSDAWLISSSPDRSSDRFLGNLLEGRDFLLSSLIVGVTTVDPNFV